MQPTNGIGTTSNHFPGLPSSSQPPKHPNHSSL
jgi:hypothetical protein